MIDLRNHVSGAIPVSMARRTGACGRSPGCGSVVRGVLPLVLAALVLCPWESFGQRVVSREVRSQLLQAGEALLFPEAEDFEARLEEAVNPFIGRAPEAPPEPDVEEEEEAPDPVAVRLPDARALQRIAESFRPRGSLIVGERRFLNLGGGRTIAEGTTFSARIGGHRYEVRVSEVTESGYALELGDATLAREFAPASQRGEAHFETPAPEETDP